MPEIPNKDILLEFLAHNQVYMTTLGIIAALVALFLEIDTHTYSGESLRELQLLLLILLVFGMLFLTVNSLIWFSKRKYAFVASSVLVTFVLISINLVNFILDNFLVELNHYIWVILVLVISWGWFYLDKARNRMQPK